MAFTLPPAAGSVSTISHFIVAVSEFAFRRQPKIVVLSWNQDSPACRPIDLPTQSPFEVGPNTCLNFKVGHLTCRSTSYPQRRIV